MTITLPSDFCADDYLVLNPDVAAAGVDAAEHYLAFGAAEGRQYKRLAPALRPKLDAPYNADGLQSVHNHDFMLDPAFKAAYARGEQASGVDYAWHWRVHMGLWAAQSALRVPGDYVECGVNKGFLSSAIMQALNWNSVGRTFYLMDTFEGLQQDLLTEAEKAAGLIERNAMELETGFYTSQFDQVQANFSQWPSAKLIKGAIPSTLAQVIASEVAFLHIDMNCSEPEIAALAHFWPKMPVGAMVLLDDYAYYGYQTQKDAMDTWAEQNGAPIASLPTGQGLIVKV